MRDRTQCGAPVGFRHVQTSNKVHACYVVFMVGISCCLDAPWSILKSWYDEQLRVFSGFHFLSDGIHSAPMLILASQLSILPGPPPIPRIFTVRYPP